MLAKPSLVFICAGKHSLCSKLAMLLPRHWMMCRFVHHELESGIITIIVIIICGTAVCGQLILLI